MTILSTGSRVQLEVVTVCTVDQTGATVTLDLGGVISACTWSGPAVQVGSTWRRTAVSDLYAADDPQLGDMPLLSGRNVGLTRVSWPDGRVLVDSVVVTVI